MNFILKKHDVDKKLLLAIIDENLKGKTLIEDNKTLDLSNDFYAGEEKTEEEVMNLINHATHINVVGNKIVSVLEKHNIIEGHMKISGTSYAQAILVRN